MKSIVMSRAKRWQVLLVAVSLLIVSLGGTAAAADVKVYAFSSVSFWYDKEVFVTGATGRWHWPVPFFIIKHDNDWVAFDLGVTGEVAKDKAAQEAYYGSSRMKDYDPYEMKPDADFVNSIKKLGLKPEQLKAVILSHGHWDHVGGINEFKNTKVPIYIQEKEMPAIWQAIGANIGKLTYNIVDWANIAKLNLKPINGVFDVFGDGSIVAFPATGHSAGIQGLMVRQNSGRYLILAQDSCNTTENYQKVVAGRVTNETLLQTLAWYKAMSYMADIVPSHDQDYYAEVRWAPAEFQVPPKYRK